MSTPPAQRRAFLRLPLAMAILLALGGPSAYAQATAATGLPSVRLTASSHPPVGENVVWDTKKQHYGELDIGLDSELFDAMAGDPPAALLLDVEAAQPGARISVRQRSVTFLNLSEEGPHVAVPGTEARSGWTVLEAAAAGRFRVLETVGQTVRLDRKHIAKVLGDQPKWLKLAQACRSPDDGACYTTTDPEFEITITTADGRTTRSIVRVFNPTGC